MPTPTPNDPKSPVPATASTATGDPDLDAVLSEMSGGTEGPAGGSNPQTATGMAPANIPPLTADTPSPQGGAGLSEIPPLSADTSTPNFAAEPTAADYAEQEAQAKAAGLRVLSEPTYQLPTLGGQAEPSLADKCSATIRVRTARQSG